MDDTIPLTPSPFRYRSLLELLPLSPGRVRCGKTRMAGCREAVSLIRYPARIRLRARQ